MVRSMPYVYIQDTNQHWTKHCGISRGHRSSPCQRPHQDAALLPPAATLLAPPAGLCTAGVMYEYTLELASDGGSACLERRALQLTSAVAARAEEMRRQACMLEHSQPPGAQHTSPSDALQWRERGTLSRQLAFVATLSPPPHTHTRTPPSCCLARCSSRAGCVTPPAACRAGLSCRFHPRPPLLGVAAAL